MSATERGGNSTGHNAFAANLACFAAMLTWSVGFPAAEVLLETWGTTMLVVVRMALGIGALLILWIVADGWEQVRQAPWQRGLGVGGLGFGLGSILLLLGQKLSDPVTPAIAAAMMPIAGAALEVLLDGRQLRLRLLAGIACALLGGFLATGVDIGDGSFGAGALMCLISVLLFAWASRSTAKDFPTLSPIGQTTITLVGAFAFMLIIYGISFGFQLPETEVGVVDLKHIALLLLFALASMALAQFLWIWGVGRLGILLASFHMNAVPFYVMAVSVVFIAEEWRWMQAVGAGLVAIGVTTSQLGKRSPR